jgi:ElaB/YqjD/DUF883 family membrane-anchored ribosome-binding protein
MNTERTIYGNPQQKDEQKHESQSTTENLRERGAEAYGKAEQAVSDAYDKTSDKVSETYDKAKVYSSEHPGTTILIALGLGLGVGLLLGASTTRRPSNRFAQPVVNALTDIASEVFR